MELNVIFAVSGRGCWLLLVVVCVSVVVVSRNSTGLYVIVVVVIAVVVIKVIGLMTLAYISTEITTSSKKHINVY